MAPNLAGVREIIAADIDEDGVTEVVLGSCMTGDVVALNITGSATSGIRRLSQPWIYGRFFEMVDLDGDGHVDVCRGAASASGYSTDGGLAVSWGNGDGTFTSPGLRDQGTYMYSSAKGDVDDDGVDELIVRTSDSYRVYGVLPGTRQIIMERFLPAADGVGVLVADLTSDGVVDIVVKRQGANSCYMQLYDMANDINALPITIDNDCGPADGFMACGDVDADGDLDLISSEGNTTPSMLHLWRNDWPGPLVQLPGVGIGEYSSGSLQVHDLNDDGLLEVFVVTDSTVRFHSIGTSFSLAPGPVVAELAGRVGGYSLFDANGDSVLDVLALTTNADLQLCIGQGSWSFGAPQLVHSWQSSELMDFVGLDVDGDDRGTPFAFFNDEMASISRFQVFPLVDDNGQAVTEVPRANWYDPRGNLVARDLDGDGDDDMVGYSSWKFYLSPESFFVVWNDGGTFTRQDLGFELGPIDDYRLDRIEFFDLNDDGLEDILVKGYTGEPPWSNEIGDPFERALVQQSNRSFVQSIPTLAVADYTRAIDMGGDGLKDLITFVSWGSVGLRVNLGGDQFAAPIVQQVEGPVGTLVMDADGDGEDELVAGIVGDGLATLSYRDVYPGALGEEVVMFSTPAPQGSGAPVPVDFDGDGQLDVLMSLSEPFVSKKLVPWRRSSTGEWVMGTPVFEGSTVRFVPLDGDGDGDTDIALAYGSTLLYSECKLAPEKPAMLTGGYFGVYPNPTDGPLTIDFGNSTSNGYRIEVQDMLGRTVLTRLVSEQIATIELPAVRTGAYVLSAYQGSSGQPLGRRTFVVASH